MGMGEHTSKFCPAIWFSGFFALGALVHLARSILHFSLVVGGYAVPLWLSGSLVFVLGGLSIALLIIGCKKPCCQTGKSSESCQK
ncbi:MAG: hypothetical protein A3G87_00640 [Omnitrophica bacterium RIFCSPLOWO2_12_FULL_50_11]|nr:MAG: hypothetical protein A3G87_00640 [Omnitrophica bacterium RIFCSPLOWO2_12_FULL_50_11]